MHPPLTAFIRAALAACLASSCATAPLPASPPPPDHAPVLTYLGVAGWRLDAGPHTLLIDPYVSRRNVGDDVETPLLPDLAAIETHTPARADLILVAHSHYDHLLDVPTIAARTGALVVGTASTHHVLAAAGIPASQVREVQGGETITTGPFTVRVLRGLHSLTGQPAADIPAGIRLPLAASGYAEGGTLQFFVTVGRHQILVISSANFIASELDGLRPDVAVVAVGLREKVPDYACRLMQAIGRPRVVYANHFDAFWQPLGPRQMDISAGARASLERFADEVHVCAPDTTVIVPQHLRPEVLRP